MANPFLNAISTSLVHRVILAYIVIDFIAGEILESDVGANGKTLLFMKRGQTDTCYHLMCLSTQLSKHPTGIFIILWFS